MVLKYGNCEETLKSDYERKEANGILLLSTTTWTQTVIAKCSWEEQNKAQKKIKNWGF